MDRNIEDIIKLLVKDNYLSPLDGEFLKRHLDNIKVMHVPVDVLKENLLISLESGKLTARNIRDFKSLLSHIENVNDDQVLSIQITQTNKGTRSVYIDKAITRTYDEL